MGITPVNEPITVYSLTPHMHLRGKSMKWWITYPDGSEEVILDVPEYDFNWQIQYELETPLKVPAALISLTLRKISKITPKLAS